MLSGGLDNQLGLADNAGALPFARTTVIPKRSRASQDAPGAASSNAERSDPANPSCIMPGVLAKERLWENLFALSRKSDRHTKVVIGMMQNA